MKLFINQTLIETTPQESDTVQTLINTIYKELDNNLVIASMTIDNQQKSIDDLQILSIPIKDIDTVELTVASKKEIGVSLLDDGKHFITFSAQELKNGSLSKKSEMLNTFSWLIDCLEALKISLIFPPTDISVLKAILREIVNTIENNQKMSLDEMKKLGNTLEDLIPHIEHLQEKILYEQPHTQENTIEKIKAVQKVLPSIAVNFQAGHDVKAIQELCVVIDMIEMFVRYAASKSENHILEQQAISLKDISLQLLKAFENKDFNLIIDLIEYDLNDHLDIILELN